jgi:hypothetical protein
MDMDKTAVAKGYARTWTGNEKFFKTSSPIVLKS